MLRKIRRPGEEPPVEENKDANESEGDSETLVLWKSADKEYGKNDMGWKALM